MRNPEDMVIVLAEDDPGHARLIQKNLLPALANKLVHFGNGEEALDYLRREECESQRHLLLLDLNMPVMDGYQVLRHLKEDPQTALIPVIVLTTTDDPWEIQRCYELGCSAYVVKSAEYGEFTEAMRRLGLFLTIVRMPEEGTISLAIPRAPHRIGVRVSKPSDWLGLQAGNSPGDWPD